jgi:hypothetical protein
MSRCDRFIEPIDQQEHLGVAQGTLEERLDIVKAVPMQPIAKVVLDACVPVSLNRSGECRK